MDYEVEQKFALPSKDDVASVTSALGLVLADPVQQVDHYFAHPARDFGVTDEAFRLRQVGEQNFVTYKGPRIDQETKTRRELELPLPAGSEIVEQFTELWMALGFRLAGTVRKMRRKAAFSWRGYECELVHDEVQELGDFMELEFVCSTEQLDAVSAALNELVAEIGLPRPERRSYLELLLARE